MKIDAVTFWVDGNDPVLNAKRASYASDAGVLNQSDVGGKTRYADVGEICWSAASICRYAPWINKLYVITDSQDPHLGSFLDKLFPEEHVPVEIVDHKTIFRGYEQFLPTFNSTSIETMMWRIPGLSERFIEFNDDFLLLKDVTPEDFFLPDGSLVCHASVMPSPLVQAAVRLKPSDHGRRKVSFKGLMLNAKKMAGSHDLIFLRVRHAPRPQLKSVYEKYFSSNPQVLVDNIKDRFRTPSQFVVWELVYELLRKERRLKVEPDKRDSFYMEPKKGGDYIREKMAKLEAGDYKFACFNSLDQASPEDRDMVINWIKRKLQI